MGGHGFALLATIAASRAALQSWSQPRGLMPPFFKNALRQRALGSSSSTSKTATVRSPPRAPIQFFVQRILCLSTHEECEQQNNWKGDAKHPKECTSTETHVNLRCCVAQTVAQESVRLRSSAK